MTEGIEKELEFLKEKGFQSEIYQGIDWDNFTIQQLALILREYKHVDVSVKNYCKQCEEPIEKGVNCSGEFKVYYYK